MTVEGPSISLNLHTGEDDKNQTDKKRKLSEIDDVSDNEDGIQKPTKKKIKDGSKDKKKTQESSKEFISSLFNHNPAIPQLDLDSQVVPLHEDVFSSNDFSSIGLHPYLIQNLQQNCKISQMTSVQSMAIPTVLAGKDALIKSQTGSGKTLAFALPIIQKLQDIQPPISRQDGVFALIVLPTRELAIQSLEWFEKLCKSFARIVPGILSGGEKKKSEKARLRKGINILIATPGRLIDHIKHTKSLRLDKLQFLVLDEADRILELGYERDVQAIITSINEQSEGRNRQTLLLSATLTSGIEQLSEISMKHPKLIDAAVKDGNTSTESLTTMTTPENLKQTFIIVPAKLRLVCLSGFLLWKCRFSRARKVLVFMSTQDMVDFHTELLDRCLNGTVDEGKIRLLKLHGNLSHKDRSTVFNEFRALKAGVMLSTDVAARGLDLPEVDWIVQYNPPTTKADYVHRVGRTARIGAKGSSLIFLLPSEARFVKQLEEEKLVLAEMSVEQILDKLFKHGGPTLGRSGQPPISMEDAATNLQMTMENAIVNDSKLHENACQAYVSYIRSYASYAKNVRDVFCFKELHLGHIAKSYALRDPPTKITGIGKGHWVGNTARKKQKDLKQEENVIKAQKKRINQKALVMSEYSSGFDGIDFSTKAEKKKTPAGRKFVRKKKP